MSSDQTSPHAAQLDEKQALPARSASQNGTGRAQDEQAAMREDSPKQQQGAEERGPEALQPAESTEQHAAPAETAATQTAPGQEQPTAETAPRAERPRPRLNPVADPSKSRAVPNVEPAARPPRQTVPQEERGKSPGREPEPSGGGQEEGRNSSERTVAEAARTAAPVAIPPTEDLDADLEAQIAAAMSGEEQQAAPAAVRQPEAAAAPARPAEEDLTPGTKLAGKVQSVGGDNAFLDLGYRSPGIVAIRQFEQGKQPQVGQVIEVVVDKVDPGEGLIFVNLPRGRRRVGGNWEALSVGQVVDCMVNKTNKGGLEITVSNLRGFLPASQVELGYISDLEKYVGQKLTVQVTEVNPQKRNLVVSRRACLQHERKEAEEQLWKTLEVGQTYSGTVKTIKDYGAFVDIGGVDGFLHIGEISWTRIRHPSDVLKEGQHVDVQVINLDPEKKKISLGMRQLTRDPWANVAETYPPGSTVTGKVTRATDFGAFVEIETGLEGLIHISELDHKRVRRVTEVVKVGQEVSAKVLEVDPGRKRVSLSLKALQEKPEEKRDEDLAPGGGASYERKRKEPLKGGTTGSPAGGGLFGDPNRFGR